MIYSLLIYLNASMATYGGGPVVISGFESKTACELGAMTVQTEFKHSYVAHVCVLVSGK